MLELFFSTHITCRDIETWLEIQPLILRIETLSIPENDLRVLVLHPMVIENLAIYHFQNKQTTLNKNEITVLYILSNSENIPPFSGAATMLLMLLFLIFYFPLACYNVNRFVASSLFSCCPIMLYIIFVYYSSGDSGTRATRTEPELQNDDRGDSGTRAKPKLRNDGRLIIF